MLERDVSVLGAAGELEHGRVLAALQPLEDFRLGLNAGGLGEACNEVDLRHDATAHAEILAMGRAGATLQCNELRGAALYSTLQPCGMCTMASIWAKVGRIVYGAGRDDVHEMYFENRHLSTENFIRDAFKDDITLEGGLLAKECAALYVPPGADVPKDQQFNR